MRCKKNCNCDYCNDARIANVMSKKYKRKKLNNYCVEVVIEDYDGFEIKAKDIKEARKKAEAEAINRGCNEVLHVYRGRFK